MSLVLRRKDREWNEHVAEVCDMVDTYIFSVSESLRHDRHAVSLLPLRAEMKAVFARYFKRQGNLLLGQISEHLRHVADGNKNVKEAEQQSRDAVAYAIPNDILLPLAYNVAMATDYSGLLAAGFTAGYENLAAELAPTEKVNADAMAVYLRENSLEKLTGELNGTTVKRLQTALADAYESGATYEDMVQAVKDEFAGMQDSRAEMISQTELNGAYNQARKQLAVDMGFNEVSWNPDGMACPVCLINVLQGWIPLGENFESGDDAPPAHPSCDCSLDIRLNNDAKIETVQ